MRERRIPSVDELRGFLAEAGVTDAPAEAPDDAHLQGLLALALHVADCQKAVSFDGFTWAEPGFAAKDARVTFRFAYERMSASREGDVRAFLLAAMPRVGAPHTLLALDARPSGLREFELGHHLYGGVTVFQHRRRPHESADPRIHRAQDAGWTPTLKEHNLVPGRGLVVLDEHHGLLLREPWLDGLQGLLVLLASGETRLWWNPFATRGDPEMQHWLAWGRGMGAPSEWREMLHVERRDEE